MVPSAHKIPENPLGCVRVWVPTTPDFITISHKATKFETLARYRLERVQVLGLNKSEVLPYSNSNPIVIGGKESIRCVVKK